MLPKEGLAKEELRVAQRATITRVRSITLAIGVAVIALTSLLTSDGLLTGIVKPNFSVISGMALVILSLLIVPVSMAALGLKGNNRIFWVTILAKLIGIGIFILAESYGLFNHITSQHIFFYLRYHVGLSIVVLFGVVGGLFAHYQHYGRFVWEEEKEPKKRLAFHLYKNKDHWVLFRDPLRWANNALHHAAISPLLLGFFLFMVRLIPNLVAPIIAVEYDSYFFLVRSFTLFLCLGLMLYNTLRPYLGSYGPLYWLFAIGFTLIFDPLLGLCYNAQNPIAQLHLIFGILLLMILVDRQSWFVVTGLFGGGSLLTYWVTYDTAHWANKVAIFGVLWPIGLSLLYTLLLGFLFIAGKEEDSAYKVIRNKMWCQSLMHETSNQLQGIGWQVNPLNDEGIAYQLVRLDKLKSKITKDPELAKHQQIKSAVKEINQIKKIVDKSMAYTSESIKDGSSYTRLLYDIMAQDSLSAAATQSVHIGALVEKADKGSPSQYSQYVKVVDGEDGMVKVAPFLVIGVLKNMIKNAVWHGGATEVVISWDGTAGIISITDNGKGIPAHMLPYIFDPGFSSGSGGMGIGLAYSKMVIEGMHGSINVASSTQGTTFRIKLPKVALAPSDLSSTIGESAS